MSVFFVSLAFLMAFAYLFPGAFAFIFMIVFVYWWICVPMIASAVVFGLLIYANRNVRGPYA